MSDPFRSFPFKKQLPKFKPPPSMCRAEMIAMMGCFYDNSFSRAVCSRAIRKYEDCVYNGVSFDMFC